MDVPAPQAGTVHELKVKTGDRVSEGDLILLLEADSAAAIPPKGRVKEDAAHRPGAARRATARRAGLYDTIEVKVPDIGDFKDVEIDRGPRRAGRAIKAEDPLITLESDKATMEVPSPAAGTAAEIKVKKGDRVSEGDLILLLRTAEAKPRLDAGDQPRRRRRLRPRGRRCAPGDLHAEVLVLGAGPGGYTAAFRAADLGKQGGAGRALADPGRRLPQCRLHPVQGAAARRQGDQPRASEMGAHGINFAAPTIDIDELRGWKDGVVKQLTGGLAGLAKQRKVTVVAGYGRFISLNQLEVEGGDGASKTVSFDQAIIAAGSEPVTLPFIPHAGPAGDRFHRCARTRRRTQAPARDRRRDHRARDGHGLPCARREGDDRRAHGPDHPRGRQGYRHAAHEADPEALREHLPQDQGHQGRG